jgi:hypothetical protein
MRISNWGFQTAEAVLIGIMSLCGTIAFTSSQIFVSFQDFAMLRFPVIVRFTPIIIGTVLFTIGVLLIMIKNKGGSFFAGLVVVFSLPSILSFDSLDLLRFFKLDLIRTQFTSNLNSNEIMAIGMVIITCYILIDFMSLLRKSRNNLSGQGADKSGTDVVYSRSHLVLLQIVVIAVIIAMLIMVFARGIELLALSSMTRLPWNLFFVGLGCITLIAVYIYWMVSRRKHIS